MKGFDLTIDLLSKDSLSFFKSYLDFCFTLQLFPPFKWNRQKNCVELTKIGNCANLICFIRFLLHEIYLLGSFILIMKKILPAQSFVDQGLHIFQVLIYCVPFTHQFLFLYNGQQIADQVNQMITLYKRTLHKNYSHRNRHDPIFKLWFNRFVQLLIISVTTIIPAAGFCIFLMNPFGTRFPLWILASVLDEIKISGRILLLFSCSPYVFYELSCILAHIFLTMLYWSVMVLETSYWTNLIIK